MESTTDLPTISVSTGKAPSTYTSLLRGAKQAKSEGKDSFEYFVKTAVGSEAYKLVGSKVIECRENVAGMTLIMLCMALIRCEKTREKIRQADEMVLMLKAHLTSLMKMRTSTTFPLSVIPEEEGVLFSGEGMSLRFLNSLIIIESLLISKLKGSSDTMKDAWKLYSSIDLMVYLELPVLMGEILTQGELADYADSIEPRVNGEKKYEEERRMAAGLVRAVPRKESHDAKDARMGMILMAVIMVAFYTVIVIKVSKSLG